MAIPDFTTSSLAKKTGEQGQVFAFALSAFNTGGVATLWTQTSGALPAGVALTPSNGNLNGTPTNSGVASATFSASNSDGVSLEDLSVKLYISLAGRPAVTSSLYETGTGGASYTYTITASNGPIINYDANNLPSGLFLDVGTGVISGTLPPQGSDAHSSFIVRASNASGQGTATNVSFTILAGGGAKPVITSPDTVSGKVGVPLTYTITTDIPATTYDATGLPNGISLTDPTMPVISGTPTTDGVKSNVSVRAANSNGFGDPLPMTWTIDPADGGGMGGCPPGQHPDPISGLCVPDVVIVTNNDQQGVYVELNSFAEDILPACGSTTIVVGAPNPPTGLLLTIPGIPGSKQINVSWTPPA